MKILMLITHLGYGGAEGAFTRLAAQMARRHEVHMAVFQRTLAKGGYTEVEPATALPLHCLDSARPEGRVDRWARRYRELRRLKTHLRPDATISFLSGPNLLNVIAKGPGLTVPSIRGSRRYEANSSKIERWLYRWLLDPLTTWGADALVCVSEGVRREMSGRRGDRPGSKFHTISGYVEPEALFRAAAQPVADDLKPLSRVPTIVAAGRMSREKGFDHLIRVFAGVKSEVPSARLLLIGDGPLVETLKRLCAELGLTAGSDAGNDVIMAGYRENPVSYFQLAKVFVLSSLSEGLPNILIEALAAGIPVVAADAPWGVDEVLGVSAGARGRAHRRSEPLEAPYGILMPMIDDPRHYAAWERILVHQLQNADLSNTSSERRRRRVRDFDCASAALQWEGLLHQLKARKGEVP